jgi:hypothetical protein
MKMTVFRDSVPCSLVETDQRFKASYCLNHRSNNVGSKHLWYVDQFIRDYTV